jgi:hypothetical protein
LDTLWSLAACGSKAGDGFIAGLAFKPIREHEVHGGLSARFEGMATRAAVCVALLPKHGRRYSRV